MSTTATAGSALRPYVPRLLADWRASHGDSRHMRVEGSLAFLDISGFTRLTERLARRGKVGAEQMSDLLSATFAALLEDARAQGADLLKWGGDAVLLLFRGDDHAGRACRAAVDMRTTLRTAGRLRADGTSVTLRMSVGIHSERFDLYLVGDPAHHRELFVVGPPASTTAELEAVASAGQIVVSDRTAALLPRSAHWPHAGGPGHLLRARPAVAATAVPSPRRREWGDASDETLGQFVPSALRRHLLSEQGDAEHRSVAVAFVRITGTDELTERAGPVAVADALDECVRVTQEATAEHDVTFFETDIDKDGAKILLVAGAPRSAGHDEERMLRTVRAVMDRTRLLPLRIGVNRGNVFAGDFGPQFRRTYSIKGDAVNLAARVMAKAADGDVLATAATLERSGTVFDTTPLEPFLVKGKTLPVHAARVGRIVGRRGALHGTTELVGRDRELAALRDALAAARAGTGALVEVVGDAGIGKTRLVDELLTGLSDVTVLRGRCGEYESSTPYFPFRALMRQALGLPADAGSSAVHDRLRRTVDSLAPELTAWTPLLGIPLDLTLTPTRQTSELDEQFRKARLEEVVAEFLTRVLTGPTALVVEDVHLADDASADLLARLAHHVRERPWLMLTTRRNESPAPDADPDVADAIVRLGSLGRDDAMRMARSAALEHPLTNEALSVLAARSGGNPLFLEELVRAAGRSGSVHDLPESVDDLVTSQIDRLEALDRTVLRYAAVLGATVELSVMRQLLDEQHSGLALDDRLPGLRDFLAPDGETRLRFRQALVRDVAYEGLPFRRRQLLHEKVGRTIELSSPDPNQLSDVLSLHFFHAGRYDRAWTYSRVAGERARAKYAHGEAIDYFQRAVDAARRSGDVPRPALAEVLESLGDARDLAGMVAPAVQAYRQARSARRDDPRAVAKLMFKEARILQRQGKVPQSLRVLSRALGTVDALDDPDARATASLLATRYSWGRLSQGRYRDALRWATAAARDAEDSGDKATLAYAYNGLHSAHHYAGVAEEIPYGHLALLAYEELDDLAGQGHSANNLGVEALESGRWGEAQALFERAAGTFGRLGDEANQANAVYNQADVLVRQGRLAEAGPLLDDVLRIARAVGDEELVALALRERARVSAGSGRHAEALDQVLDARHRFRALGLAQELPALATVEAECLLLAGLPAEAAAAAQSAAATPGAGVTADDPAPSLRRVRGFALLACGRTDDAADDLRAVSGSDGAAGPQEIGFALLGLSLLATDDRERQRLRTESAALLDPLGVVVSATWPPR